MKRLVTRYHGPLVRFFTKHSQNTWDAEELTQEVFCKILKRNDIPIDQYPESHLYTIAWSVLRDRARRDRVRLRDRHTSLEEALTKEEPLTVEEVLNGEEQYQCFLSTLSELNAKTRDVFLLNRYEGLTYNQIAEHYGISVSAVEKHMMKALALIKKNLHI